MEMRDLETNKDRSADCVELSSFSDHTSNISEASDLTYLISEPVTPPSRSLFRVPTRLSTYYSITNYHFSLCPQIQKVE